MTMATVSQRKVPEPRYKNTVVCEHCFTEYNPSLSWIFGYHTKETTDDFQPLGTISEGKCPICRQKQQTDI